MFQNSLYLSSLSDDWLVGRTKYSCDNYFLVKILFTSGLITNIYSENTKNIQKKYCDAGFNVWASSSAGPRRLSRALPVDRSIGEQKKLTPGPNRIPIQSAKSCPYVPPDSCFSMPLIQKPCAICERSVLYNVFSTVCPFIQFQSCSTRTIYWADNHRSVNAWVNHLIYRLKVTCQLRYCWWYRRSRNRISNLILRLRLVIFCFIGY